MKPTFIYYTFHCINKISRSGAGIPCLKYKHIRLLQKTFFVDFLKTDYSLIYAKKKLVEIAGKSAVWGDRYLGRWRGALVKSGKRATERENSACAKM